MGRRGDEERDRATSNVLAYMLNVCILLARTTKVVASNLPPLPLIKFKKRRRGDREER